MGILVVVMRGNSAEERASGLVVVSNVWSPVYVDAMISRDRDTDNNGTLDERLYVLHDANFNVTGLVNTSGTEVERFTYEPFGKAEIRDASWAIKSGGSGSAWLYLHQGGRFDSISGLYAFRMREYSPTLGRWMTNDPIGYRGGDVNTFCLVTNNVTNLLDSFGLFAQLPPPPDLKGLEKPIPVEPSFPNAIGVPGSIAIVVSSRSFARDGISLSLPLPPVSPCEIPTKVVLQYSNFSLDGPLTYTRLSLSLTNKQIESELRLQKAFLSTLIDVIKNDTVSYVYQTNPTKKCFPSVVITRSLVKPPLAPPKVQILLPVPELAALSEGRAPRYISYYSLTASVVGYLEMLICCECLRIRLK